MNWIRALCLLLLCLALLVGSTSCGKCSESPEEGQTTDTTAPSSPSNLACTSPCNAATRTFAWDAATDDDSGVDHYLVTIDGGGVGNLWTILGNVATYTFEAALAYPDGSHTFEVKAVDKAGNEGTAATLSFICDTTPPTISGVSASNTTKTSCTITWTTNEDAVCQVEYGTTLAYGSAEPASIDFLSSYAYSYIINLAGLTAHTKYHY